MLFFEPRCELTPCMLRKGTLLEAPQSCMRRSDRTPIAQDVPEIARTAVPGEL